jgi:DNA-binding NarL/FixJ family response regulator
MNLTCLTIIDEEEIEARIRQILLTENISIVQDNRYLLNPAKMAGLKADIVIVSLSNSALAIPLLEDFCRLSPTTKLIYLFNEVVASSSTLSFFKAIEMMADYVIPESEIYKVKDVLQEIYQKSYYLVKRIVADIDFSNRELDILLAMQMGLGVDDISQKLKIGKQAIRKHLSNCSKKFNCDNNVVVAMSFRILGDLTLKQRNHE